MAHQRASSASPDAATHAIDGSATSPPIEEIRVFFAGIPHWTANAGLSTDGAERAAEVLGSLAERLRRLDVEPEETTGPDPAGFPPPSDRIADAGQTIDRHLRAMNDDDLAQVVDGQSMIERCQATMTTLLGLATT